MYLCNEPAFRLTNRTARFLSWLHILCLLTLLAPSPGVAADTNTSRRVHFREPHHTHYILLNSAGSNSNGKPEAANAATRQWTQARLDNGGTNTVELSSRVVLQLAPGKDLSGLLATQRLTLSRTVNSNLFILQAADSMAA